MNNNEKIIPAAEFNESWSRWDLAPGIAGNYGIQGVHDDLDGFKILLLHDNTNQKVELFFPDSVWAYRSTTDSFRYDLFGKLFIKYDKDFYQEHAFFKVEQSIYLQWIVDESGGILNDYKDFQHLVIKGINSMLDIVVSKGETPKVKFL